MHHVVGLGTRLLAILQLSTAVDMISGSGNKTSGDSPTIIVLQELLGLCEQKRGKDNKAIIASNIMYIVGQYPRFLRSACSSLSFILIVFKQAVLQSMYFQVYLCYGFVTDMFEFSHHSVAHSLAGFS